MYLKEVLTNEQSVLVDSDAANKAADADAALQDLGSDQIGQAYVTATVTVWDADAAIAIRDRDPLRGRYAGVVACCARARRRR